MTDYNLNAPLEPGQATTISYTALSANQSHTLQIVLDNGKVVGDTVSKEEATSEAGYAGPPVWTWGDDVRLTNDASNSRDSNIASSGDYVHVVWADERDDNYEIYYKRSTDNGITWGADTRLTTAASVYIIFPFIAVSSDNVHITWTDERDGNQEIYYKRGYYD